MSDSSTRCQTQAKEVLLNIIIFPSCLWSRPKLSSFGLRPIAHNKRYTKSLPRQDGLMRRNPWFYAIAVFMSLMSGTCGNAYFGYSRDVSCCHFCISFSIVFSLLCRISFIFHLLSKFLFIFLFSFLLLSKRFRLNLPYLEKTMLSSLV